MKTYTELKEYFENAKGHGVLATADGQGLVDIAVYARPHFVDGQRVAFIMSERLTHENLQFNPHAAYLFTEEGSKSDGLRIYLKKVSETEDPEAVESLRRERKPLDGMKNYPERKFAVYFSVEKVRPLVGD